METERAYRSPGVEKGERGEVGGSKTGWVGTAWLVRTENGHLLSRKRMVKVSECLAGQIPWEPFLSSLLDRAFLGPEIHPWVCPGMV